MKVLHVVSSLGALHGGVSASVRELCWGLSRIGAQVELLTTTRGYEPAADRPADEDLRASGVALRYFPVHPWRWLGTSYAFSPELEAALRGAISRMDIVHIHALWLHPTLIASRLCHRSHIPYLLSPCGALDPYGLRSHRAFKILYGWAVERKTLARAAALHFTSRMEQEKAFTFGLKVRSVVVPCSIRMETIPRVPSGTFRAAHPELANRRIVLFLGRLHPKKRLDLAAEAFIRMAQKRPEVHLVAAGADQGSVPPVRSMLAQAGLLDRVTFTGMLTGQDKWAALQDSSLFLLPSEDENFGVAVLEAMAVRVPVLVSPAVAIAEYVSRSQAGWVVDQNPEAWANAIETLLNDTGMCRTMGESGRHLAETEFATERVATTMKGVYLSILEGCRGSHPAR